MKKTISKKTKLIFILILLIGLFILFFKLNNKYQNNYLEGQKTLTDQNAQNIVERENSFILSIPSIGVSAPVVQGVDPANKEVYNEALQTGVAHMTGTALPGDNKGNIFIYGHSSASEASQYDKIFANLNGLQVDDAVFVNYKNKIYNYIVIDKKIVEKDDLSVLNQTKNETITLMTCWPVGTTDQRLVVTAVLI